MTPEQIRERISAIEAETADILRRSDELRAENARTRAELVAMVAAARALVRAVEEAK